MQTRRKVIAGLLLIACLGIAAPLEAQPWQKVHKFVASDANNDNSLFGESVAMSADKDRLVIGASGNNVYGEGSGAVYVYERSNGSWAETKLISPQGQPDELFGQSVAIQGNLIAVGAPGADQDRGAAYLFRKTGGSWQGQRFTAANRLKNAHYGRAVALGPTWMAVGASEDTNATGERTGAVYLYALGNNSTVIKQTPPASNGASNNYGFSLAMADTKLVVGAMAETGQGSAYLLEANGLANWNQVALPPVSLPPKALYGANVAIAEGRIAVAAPYATYAGEAKAGLIYVFERRDGTWYSQRLSANLGSANSLMGVGLAISNRWIAGGAQRETTLVGPRAGVTYMFQRSQDNWQRVQNLSPKIGPATYPNNRERFGSSAALAGNYLLVGAMSDSLQGAAYLYRWRQPPQVQLQRRSPCAPGQSRLWPVITGGTPPYRLQWADGSTDSVRRGLPTGTYSIKVTDRAGRSARDTLRLESSGPLRLTVDSLQHESCRGASDGRIRLSRQGGVPPYRYMWEGKPGDSSRSQLAPGAYHVQVQDRCNTKDDTTLRILPGPDPTAALHLAQQPPLRPGRPLRLSNESVRADSFSWQIGQQTLADTRVPAGTSFQRSGEQPLQLRAYANGCADTATRTISVSGIAVALPSAFSPDGDGRNDRWQPYGPSAHLAGRLRVYSRWGELVHESSGQRPGWNGRCGGAPCPPGVYTYELQLRAGAEQITRRGTITLLR